MGKNKNTKVSYKSRIADKKIAETMDVLSNEYRIKEKLFPIKVAFGVDDKPISKKIEVYNSLMEMANSVCDTDWFRQENSFINRYDEDGYFIKKHIHRNNM